MMVMMTTTYLRGGVVNNPLAGSQILGVLEPPVQVALTDDAEDAGEAHGNDKQDNERANLNVCG